MANTFKVDTKSDCVTDAHTSSNANVLTAGGSATLVLLSILISNTTGSSADVDVFLVTNTGDDVFLIRNAPVPAGSSLEIISGSKIIMESSDVLRVRSDTASAIDVAVSYLEQT
tara:strand:- start:280 stop:621 length:342 start_codon:yes stop_codon:yes gene_type:complete